MAGLTIFYSILDKEENITIDVGESSIDFTGKSDFILSDITSSPVECSTNISRNKGRERVGKIVYRISKISVFSSGESRSKFSRETKPEKDSLDELNVLSPLADFQFNRLVKPVHWERLKGLNLDRLFLLLFCFILFYFVSFCFILLYFFVLFYCILFYFILFYSQL